MNKKYLFLITLLTLSSPLYSHHHNHRRHTNHGQNIVGPIVAGAAGIILAVVKVLVETLTK